MEFTGDHDGLELMGYLYINIGLTFSSWIFIIVRERVRLDLLKDRGEENQKSTLFSSGRYRLILKDMLILAMHPYPFLIGYRFYTYNKFTHSQIYYYYNDVMGMLTLCRLCYILSKTFSITRWQSCSADRIW